MSIPNNVALSFDSILMRIARIDKSWKLALKALEVFRNDSAAFSTLVDKEHGAFLEGMREAHIKRDKEDQFIANKIRFEQMRDGFESDLAQIFEETVGDIHTSYFINFTAILEELMKDAVRVLLRDNPMKLDQNRKVDLGKVIALGPEAILDEEIERQIYSLDRKSIEERVKYFDEEFGINLFDQPGIAALSSVFTKRNALLHDQGSPRAKEEDVTNAFLVTMLISIGLSFQMQFLGVLPRPEIESAEVSDADEQFKAFPKLLKYRDERAGRRSDLDKKH